MSENTSNPTPDYTSDYMPETKRTRPPNLTVFIVLILILGICITLSTLFITGKIPFNQKNQTVALEEEVFVDPSATPLAQNNLADFNTPPSPSQPTTILTPLNTQPPTAPTTPAAPIPTPTPTPNPTKNETQWIPITSTPTPTSTTTSNAQHQSNPSRVSSIKTYLNGTLHLQGNIPDNAEILILARPVGTSDYQPIQRLKAATTINWTWNNALPGTTYEVTFALQVNQNNLRTSPVGTAKAPATIETWMNTGQGNSISDSNNSSHTSTSNNSNKSTSSTSSSSRRAGTPRLVSCDNHSDNTYSANLRFPRVEGAEQYLVQIGTSATATDVYDQHLDPANGDLYVRLNFENDKSYYIRYSYADCRDCGNSFQGQSAIVEVKCQRQ